jgi:hypothetical protein
MSTRGSERRRKTLLPWIPLRLRLTLWVLFIFSAVHVTISLVIILFYGESDRKSVV